MIALPILGVSAADLTLRSAELSPAETVTRRIGAADAVLTSSGTGAPVYQKPDGGGFSPVGGFTSDELPEPGPQQLVSLVPAGAESLKDSSGHAKVRTRYGLLDTALREVDLSSPLVKGMVVLDRGRTPEEAGEVVATNAFLKASGLFVGSQFTPRGSSTWYRIVGAYELPSELGKSEVIAPPGTLLTPLDKELQAAGVPGVVADDSYLVKVGPGGFTWNMVKEANAKGVLVHSRAVVLDPPASSDVPLYAQMESLGDSEPRLPVSEMAGVATIVGLAVLEICLLAGPAFAVGARRSRRQLGLVGANGGDRRHIRAIVLSGGLVIGAAAAVLGTAAGTLLTVALRPLLEEFVGARFGSLDVRPLEIAGIALLAVVTGLLAAVVPAVTASRQPVLASLTGRRGVRRANRVLPVVGLAAIGLGAAIALFGAASGTGASVVVFGSALAELGLVALTPVLIGLFGRLGHRLPLSPRLALRDAVRNRGRTAPAVAAVLAAVAGTVAVATYEHSSEAQARFEYVAELPAGSGKVELHESGHQKTMAAVREAVSRELPLAVRADVDHVQVGGPGCEQPALSPGCGRAEIIRPKEQRCPLFQDPLTPSSFSDAERKALLRDWRCASVRHGAMHRTVVADEKLLATLAVTDPGTVSALKSGRAVSFDRRDVKDGKVTLRLVPELGDDARGADGEDPPGRDAVFAVHQAPEGVHAYGIALVLPPSAARAAGLTTQPFASYFTLDGKATDRQQQLAAQIDRIGVAAPVLIESGYRSESNLTLLALTVFAGLVTIGAAGIATGLAQTDAEPDLRTLAAVGAAPRVRRAFSGFQCGLVAFMGVVLGTVSGMLPAVGLRLFQRREAAQFIEEAGGPDDVLYVPIVLPWETFGALLVLVPLGAALLAALVTRSDGGFARRAAA
ncbi:FtsX-like permease family protein [Streptomyces sp. NPDC059851]|uniref:FtsX-like permease family protein n=1 Tax=Streptomyces sp. NPDC059851 TaxID=3346971 RepID=UPI00365D2424